MEYLTQFNNDFINGKIQVHKDYVEQTIPKTGDVVTDLIDKNCPVSAACLPVAKQIIILEKKLCFKLPRIGDLFIGLVHHHVIEKVTFIISNYTDEFIIDGQLEKVNNILLWRLSELPIILSTINDYENVCITIRIDINNSYNLQNNNREVFEACFGYFGQSIRQQLGNFPIYQIPLLNGKNCMKIVCGIWTIV
jgi:hypothetical protein